MIRHLGYACNCMTLSDPKTVKKKERVFTCRTYRMARHSLEVASDIGYANAYDLKKILQWNEDNSIKYFRISSDMFPFMDHPDLAYKLDDLKLSKHIRGVLHGAGKFARDNGHRLSMHPGPYTCIASPNEDVVAKSLLCLEMHNLIAELLGAGDDFKINIHVGGTYEGKAETAARFCKNFYRLSPACQARLTVENDDKPSQWAIEELHDMIHTKIGLALCFDIHHFHCHKGDFSNSIDAYKVAEPTWRNVVPEVHYSEPREYNGSAAKYRAHSDYLEHMPADLSDNPYDLMLETKMKEKALLSWRKNVYSKRDELIAIM